MKVTINLIDVAIWLVFSYIAIYITGLKEFIYVAQGGLLFYSINFSRELITNDINSRILSRQATKVKERGRTNSTRDFNGN